MNQRLIRFSRGPNTRRSYFVNNFLVKNLGKTKVQIKAASDTWPELIDHPKHGTITLAGLLLKEGQRFEQLLGWATDDFTFFSWNKSGQLILGPDNVETCLLVDRLLQAKVGWGDNQGRKPETVVWAWKKGGLGELRKLGARHLSL